MTRPTLRAVFMGTPEFAARIMARVLETRVVDIVAAYTQPDRPAGRGKALKAPEVKVLAERHGLPVLQPINFRRDEDVLRLRQFEPDVLLVAAYGLILPQRVLDLPRLMPINVHASLLPKYRGAAPIQRAVMNGDLRTGVTIMRMLAGMDTGPILMHEHLPITDEDTSGTLHDKLAEAGAELLIDALRSLEKNTLTETPQEESQATYAPKLEKSEGRIDFSLPGRTIHARLRGVTPWPGGLCTLKRPGHEDLPIKVGPGLYYRSDELRTDNHTSGPPGTFAGLLRNMILVNCPDGVYAFRQLTPASGKTMDGQAFFNGYLFACSQAEF